MQWPSYPTETVLSTKITRELISPIIQRQSQKTIRTATFGGGMAPGVSARARARPSVFRPVTAMKSVFFRRFET